MTEWYLRQNGESSGPYSCEELRFLCERRKIGPQDELKQGTAGSWISAEKMPGLLETATPAAAPAQPRTPATRALHAPPPKAPAGQPTAAPAPNIRPSRVPPPVPSERYKERHGPTTITVVIAAGVLSVFVLLLLMAVFARHDTIDAGNRAGDSGNETGIAAGAASNGESPEAAAGNDAMGAANEGAAANANGTTAAAPQAGEDASPQSDDPPPKDEAEPSASPMTVEPSNDAAGSSDSAPSDRPPPRTAAVIMPLDDDAPDDGANAPAGVTCGSAEFFQIKSAGRHFAYVVDCSGSMAGEPFAKACAELRRSIERLNSGQSFFVVFFDHGEYPQFYPAAGERLLRASAANKQRLKAWVDDFNMPGGGTDPSAALSRALAVGPDAIYLLSDGEFDEEVARELRATNHDHVAIHTVSFITRDAEVLLKRISRENHGTYRYVP